MSEFLAKFVWSLYRAEFRLQYPKMSHLYFKQITDSMLKMVQEDEGKSEQDQWKLSRQYYSTINGILEVREDKDIRISTDDIGKMADKISYIIYVEKRMLSFGDIKRILDEG